jgi:hypothetical protein
MTSLYVLAILFIVAAPTFGEPFYVLDGSRLTYVRNGDENDLQNVKEWHIRLYRRGEETTGSPWGLIVGKSAGDVARQLKKSQDFELFYEKVFRSRDKLTFFNPLGPIAVIDRRDPLKKKLDKVKNIYDRYGVIVTAYLDANRLLLGMEEGTPNIYRDVGITLTHLLQFILKNSSSSMCYKAQF